MYLWLLNSDLTVINNCLIKCVQLTRSVKNTSAAQFISPRFLMSLLNLSNYNGRSNTEYGHLFISPIIIFVVVNSKQESVNSWLKMACRLVTYMISCNTRVKAVKYNDVESTVLSNVAQMGTYQTNLSLQGTR